MAFQYQYQYQLIGFMGEYSSFYEVLKDIPLNIIYLSILFSLGPIAIMILARSQIVHTLLAFYKRRKMEKDINNRIMMTYDLLKKKEKREFLPLITLTIIAGVFFLAATKMIFFSLVVGESMLFTLVPTDLVLTQRINTQVEPGDIIVFQTHDNLNPIIHRAISVTDSGVVTARGDNRLNNDPWGITQEQILGKAVTLRGKPVVLKRIGIYFTPVRDVGFASDPVVQLVRDFVFTSQRYGLIIVAVILLIILLDSSSKPTEFPGMEI
jgi:signal peptidase I